MIKLFVPALTTYPHTLVTTMRSKWMWVVFILPVVLYVAFISFERPLTTLIIPLFPDERDKSFGFYNDFLWLCFNELLWLDLFLLTGWLFFAHASVSAAMDKFGQWMERNMTMYVVALSLLFLIAAVLVARFTLDAFPNSADEYVYLYQAETLSKGKLVEQAHPLEQFFHFNHIAQKDGISVGRFPPGWPLLLTLPYLMNFPVHWLNPLLGVASLVIFFSFARRYYNNRVAIWSLFSLALTGYFVFNGASYFSHMSCLLFTLAFVFLMHLANEKPGYLYPLFAGVFLGLIVITRYYTAVLIFLPVLISLVYNHRWNAIRILFFIGLGVLPFLIFLFWYNYAITGNPLLPVTVWADSSESIGFVKGHTFGRATEYTIRRLLLFTYWCSPALLILYFVYLFQKIRQKSQRFIFAEDYFLLMLLAGYFFYHHLGGNQYGPRFLFEALPFAIVMVISRVVQAKQQLPMALIAAGMIYAIVKFPYIIERENRVVDERVDLYEKVQEAGISNAVVLVSTHTSVIRPMPPRDLTRNDISYQRSVIYAEDLGRDNRLLMEFYPDRHFYRYVRNPEKVEGALIKIR